MFPILPTLHESQLAVQSGTKHNETELKLVQAVTFHSEK